VKIIVAQKSAREHYAVARALQQQGLLAGLVTDWYAFGRQNRKQKASTYAKLRRDVESRNEKTKKTKAEKSHRFSISAFQYFGWRVQSALSARADGIPDELVRAFPFRSMLWKWRVRRLAAQKRSHEAYLQTDAAFAAAVARLKLPPHDVFFGYSYASLEVLEAEKKRGVLTVLDQIDPGAMEFQLVAEEMARFPELAGAPTEFPAAYYERNRREWELADVIVVNSEWSREAIIAEGANPAKIEILPLAYEINDEKLKAESRDLQPSTFNPQPSTTPLRVLWLGQVNVRKGIHYLMQAAKLLANEPVRFDVVGSIGILPRAVASAPRKMTFHGPVSRSGAAEWYRKADLFVLPTLSDGFALTQLEALAYGLPVIVTPNCGQVVEEGETGFIIPPRDPQALADAIVRFVRHPSLARGMAPACLEAVKAFSVEKCGMQLVQIIEKHKAHRPA
jgi:glycosyltransferase involved in cell wall biosynthesis